MEAKLFLLLLIAGEFHLLKAAPLRRTSRCCFCFLQLNASETTDSAVHLHLQSSLKSVLMFAKMFSIAAGCCFSSCLQDRKKPDHKFESESPVSRLNHSSSSVFFS